VQVGLRRERATEHFSQVYDKNAQNLYAIVDPDEAAAPGGEGLVQEAETWH